MIADNMFQSDEDKVKVDGQDNIVEAVDILYCAVSENVAYAAKYDNPDANVDFVDSVVPAVDEDGRCSLSS